MAKRYAEWILSHKLVTILAALIWVLAMGAGVPRLTFTNDYRVFFGADNPQLLAFETLQDTYSRNDNIMMVVAPDDGNVFTRETLSAVAWLTERAWETPYSTRVESLSNYQHTSADGDDLLVEDLAYEAENLGDEDLARIREIAIAEPVLVNRLISPDGAVTGVNINVELPGVDPTTENPEAVEFVRALREEFHAKYPDIRVRLTGVIMMNQAFPEASEYDMSTLFPVMVLLFMVVLLFWVNRYSKPVYPWLAVGLALIGVLGSFGLLGVAMPVWLLVGFFLPIVAFVVLSSGTVATLLVIFFSILGAMGLAGWLGIALTPPSFTAIMIIPTMSIAHSVHVLMNYILMMQKGETRHEAMVDSLRINMQPVFLTSVTTAIGFLSMNFSDVPPFHDLGNIVAMGVMIAFVLSMTLLPALVMLLPGKEIHEESASSRAMARFAEFVVVHRGRLLLGMGLGTALIVSMVPLNELNDDFVKYFDERIEFRRDADFASERLAGLYLIDWAPDSGEQGGVSNPAFQRHLENFANWLREQPEVKHVNVLSDTFKRLNRSMHGDDDAWYRLPEQRELAAQYLLLYEMSLPYGLDLNNQINIDKSATRMTVMLHNMTSTGVLELERRVDAWLRDNVPEAMRSVAASPTIMFSHIGQRNIQSMLLGTTVALVFISFILVFALRSVKIGLVSLIPNLIPAALAFGVWGLFVGQVGLALSVVTGMTLGIVVDDTVHFLSKYLRARREKGLDAEDAVRYAFGTVGLALVVTSLVLVAGFMVLAFSAFTLNADMGVMTAVTIAFALVADFLLLPPLLMAVDRDRAASADAATADHASADAPA